MERLLQSSDRSRCCARGVPNWCAHIESLVMPVGNIGVLRSRV
jgi:hypothetical protein